MYTPDVYTLPIYYTYREGKVYHLLMWGSPESREQTVCMNSVVPVATTNITYPHPPHLQDLPPHSQYLPPHPEVPENCNFSLAECNNRENSYTVHVQG